MNSGDESKIIVDDDWKEQVQREKEQIEKTVETEPPAQEIPEASFGLLVTSLTTQALAALGFLPIPGEQNPEVNREIAKHFIDSLSVLQEKTAGNLTAEEVELLSESLHQLRMSYVAAGTKAGDTATDEKSSSIEIP